MVRAALVFTHERGPTFYVADFGERCNEKEAKDEETNFVKRAANFVKQRL